MISVSVCNIVASVLATGSLYIMSLLRWPVCFCGLVVYFMATLPANAHYNAYWGKLMDNLAIHKGQDCKKLTDVEESESLLREEKQTQRPPFVLLGILTSICSLCVQVLIQIICLSVLEFSIMQLWIFLSILSTIFCYFFGFSTLLSYLCPTKS